MSFLTSLAKDLADNLDIEVGYRDGLLRYSVTLKAWNFWEVPEVEDDEEDVPEAPDKVPAPETD